MKYWPSEVSPLPRRCISSLRSLFTPSASSSNSYEEKSEWRKGCVPLHFLVFSSSLRLFNSRSHSTLTSLLPYARPSANIHHTHSPSLRALLFSFTFSLWPLPGKWASGLSKVRYTLWLHIASYCSGFLTILLKYSKPPNYSISQLFSRGLSGVKGMERFSSSNRKTVEAYRKKGLI